MRSGWLVVSYWAAAVAANVLASRFGQVALPWVAFFIIPFDLCARDVLHDRWKGRDLWWSMFVLVLTGSMLTIIFSPGSARVAIASAIAFASAGVADTVIYAVMRRSTRFARMNGSNAVSAVVDSIVFPTVAFGGLSLWLSGAQAVSKFVGGVLWSVLFLYWIRKGERN